MGVLVQELLVGQLVFEQIAVERQRHHHVGTRSQRQMDVGLTRQVGPSRVQHHQRGTRLLGSLDVRHQVDTGTGGVRPPDDNEPGMLIIGVGHAGHLAVERLVRGTGRDGTDRAGQPRRAELPEQPCVNGVLGQQAVRPAVGKGQDRLGAPLVANLDHPCGDRAERLVPARPPEAALAPRAFTEQWMADASLAVDTLVEPSHLAADVAVGYRVRVGAVDGDDLPLLDRHFETAGVGTVELAHRVDCRPAPRQVFVRL